MIRYVATIMKKYILSSGEVLYAVDSVLSGSYNEKTKIFTGDNGIAYNNLCLDDNSKNIYYNIIKFSDLLQNEKYLTAETEDDLFESYLNDFKYYIYLINNNPKNGKPMIVALNIANLKNLNINDVSDISEKNNPSCSLEDDEEVAEFVAAIASGKFSIEELEEIKKTANITMNYINTINDSINSYLGKDSDLKQVTAENININDVYNKIKESLIGQDIQARRMIVEISRILDNESEDGILLTGNSGCGKTLLMKLLSKYLKRPFLIIDSTQLSSPGHVGKNIEQCLWELYELANYDLEAAEHAIIYFDEIDKKGSEKKSDVSGQAVLNQLLKFIEGSTYTACSNPQLIMPESSVQISTKNMTVIAGGAFSEIYEYKEKNSIGFDSAEPNLKREPSVDDFITKAMMPKEFMGRLPIIIHLDPLNQDTLKKILTDSDISPLYKQKINFMKRGVELKVTPEFIDKISSKAFKRKIGARGLNKLIKDTTWKPYDVIFSSDNDVYESVILDGDTVDNPEHFQLIKKKTNV